MNPPAACGTAVSYPVKLIDRDLVMTVAQESTKRENSATAEDELALEIVAFHRLF